MPIPRPRFTVRRLMIAVAVSAPVAAIGAKTYDACQATGLPQSILVAVAVTGLVGFLALRKPLTAIPFVVLVFLMTPRIATFPRMNYFELPSQGAMLAWSVGAPVGWILRTIRKGGRKPTRNVEPPGTSEVDDWLRNHFA